MDIRQKIRLARLATLLLWQFSGSKGDIGNRPPVLCYHRVLPEFVEDENTPIYTLLPENFESQMAFLNQEGFQSLSMSEYAAIARGRRPAPPRSVLITFDDGYADNYAVAWQIAQRHRIKLNLFVCTGTVGLSNPIVMTEDGYVSLNPSVVAETRLEVLSHIQRYPHLWRPLTWQELGEMRDSGVEIGFHSHEHHNLALLNPDELEEDIAKGMAVFEENLGYLPRFFALPYGSYGYYTSAVIAVLRRFGLELIFSTNMNRARLPSDRLIFPRHCVHQVDNLSDFRRKLFGACDWLDYVFRMRFALSNFLRDWNINKKLKIRGSLE